MAENDDVRTLRSDSDGLQVCEEPSGLQVGPDPHYGELKEVNKESEAPEKLRDIPGADYDKEVVALGLHIMPILEDLAERRTLWFVGVIIVISIITAAIVGGVLGTKAASNSSITATSPAPSSTMHPSPGTSPSNSTESTQTSGSRQRSKIGTWNGTGIALIQLYENLDSVDVPRGTIQCQCIFQDWAGQGQILDFEFDTVAGNISSYSIRNDFDSPAMAPGTALAASRDLVSLQDPSLGYWTHILYITPGGTLGDFYITNTSDFFGNFSTVHNQSPLSASTPIDNRPVLYELEVPEGQNAVFLGANDGLVHVLLSDSKSGNWSATGHVALNGSWAYGGMSPYTMIIEGFERENSSILTSGPAGALQGWQMQGSSTLNGTVKWIGPITNETLMLPNTSFASFLRYRSTTGQQSVETGFQLLAVFANSEGTMGMLTTEFSQPPTMGFGTYDTSLHEYKIMQGSDVASLGTGKGVSKLNGDALIFYQDEGTSLAWLSFDPNSNGVKGSGRLISNSTEVWEMVWTKFR